jgi:N-acetylglutamate synthase-like GNAT family acetyltransferase
LSPEGKSGFILRQAVAADAPLIRDVIRRVQINPFGLDWRRFVIAVDEAGAFAGCGQLKPHSGGVVELASLAVEPRFRHRGVARAVIEHLISKGPRPLYLTCRGSLGSFYQKWGFRVLALGEMPPYFRRLASLASLFNGLIPRDEGLLVMMLQ